MKFRHEIKQRISELDITILKRRLPVIMKRDAHCGNDGTYRVKSLYFDNYTDIALREKLDGVDKREKFRIRYYNDDTSFIRLEKKSKINGLCLKQSASMTSEQVERLLNGDFKFLLESENELFLELYAKMQAKLLRPKTIVAYDRESFVYAPGNVRVTIDSGICGSGNVCGFLQSDTTMTHLYNTAILEVKWDEFLPQVIQDAVTLNSRKTTAFSKYAAVRF